MESDGLGGTQSSITAFRASVVDLDPAEQERRQLEEDKIAVEAEFTQYTTEVIYGKVGCDLLAYWEVINLFLIVLGRATHAFLTVP